MKIKQMLRSEPKVLSLADARICEIYWPPSHHSSTAIMNLGPTDSSCVAYRVLFFYGNQAVTSVVMASPAKDFMVAEFSDSDSLEIGR